MQSNALLKPRIIEVQNVSPVHARVTMEPFERGFGHTLGNALRRILLSSLPGYAPTEVSIEAGSVGCADDRSSGEPSPRSFTWAATSFRFRPPNSRLPLLPVAITRSPSR